MDTSINLRLHFVLLLLLYGLDVCFQISDPNQILAWSVKERSPDRHITRAVRMEKWQQVLGSVADDLRNSSEEAGRRDLSRDRTHR